jgi:hypothetical protein
LRRIEKKGRLLHWEKTADISRLSGRFLASVWMGRVSADGNRATLGESAWRSAARLVVQGFFSSLVGAEGVAVGAGALAGGAPALGLAAGVGFAAGGGSSGLQPTTTIIANAAPASSDRALMPNLAITDELLDVKHVTSRIVTLEYPLDTERTTASRK